jgi:prepilin-type N-terminal cleavage/methylation domain-containing protein
MNRLLKISIKNNKKGFTLIELLIVIAVMAILTTVVFVALNPMARFQDARNNRRYTDVNAILSAIKLDQVDNGGEYLADVDELTADLSYLIGSGENCNTITCPGITLQSACVNINDLADGGYLPSIPFDPNAEGASAEFSHYYLIKWSNGSITVGACAPEQGSGASTPAISVRR